MTENNSNKIHPCEVLYITEDTSWGEIGYNEVKKTFPDATGIFWSHDMEKPDLDEWHGDWILSFKSDLILPISVIDSAEKGAVNFHPASPQYRGIGGYYWALQNGDKAFGATCHHMNHRIDHGEIIKADYFPISQDETVESLSQKAAYHALNQLRGVLRDIVAKKPLEPCGVPWSKRLYTQKELDAAQNVAGGSDLDVGEFGL